MTEEETEESEESKKAEEVVAQKEETVVESTEEQALEQQEEMESAETSWEKWACQTGLEIPRLVVWNENGKQEIIEPGTTYVMEEGDRFAVPTHEALGGVMVNSKFQERVETEYGEYYNVPIEKGENIIQYSSYGERYKYIVEKD